MVLRIAMTNLCISIFLVLFLCQFHTFFLLEWLRTHFRKTKCHYNSWYFSKPIEGWQMSFSGHYEDYFSFLLIWSQIFDDLLLIFLYFGPLNVQILICSTRAVNFIKNVTSPKKRLANLDDSTSSSEVSKIAFSHE